MIQDFVSLLKTYFRLGNQVDAHLKMTLLGEGVCSTPALCLEHDI